MIHFAYTAAHGRKIVRRCVAQGRDIRPQGAHRLGNSAARGNTAGVLRIDEASSPAGVHYDEDHVIGNRNGLGRSRPAVDQQGVTLPAHRTRELIHYAGWNSDKLIVGNVGDLGDL